MLDYIRRGATDRTKKLLPHAIGPYMVKKRISTLCYELEDILYDKRSWIYRTFKVHANIMRLYVFRKETDWAPWEREGDEEE